MTAFLETTEKDIPLLQNMAREAWQSAYEGILQQAQTEYMLAKMYSAGELARQMKNPDFRFFIIQNSEQNCGFMSFQFNFEEDTAKLHKLYLLPGAKGKGAGKDAAAFLKKSVENKNRRIILAVNKKNTAKKFYEHCGFTVYRDAVTDIGGGYVMDDYLMEYIFP